MKRLLFAILLTLPLFLSGQEVFFSSERGFYESAFQLTLTTDMTGGEIRYTTDGTPPTTTTGTIYSGEIPITTTTAVRAIAYAGANTTPVATHTYLFLADVINQPANIAGWPNNVYDLGQGSDEATHDYEMDPAVVNNPAYSSSIISGLMSIPTMSLVMDQGRFQEMYDGSAPEITSVEVIYPNTGDPSEQFDLAVESHSHLRLKRSMKLVVESPYTDGITSNLFKSAPLNGAGAATRFEETKIVLRGGNNRSWARNWNADRTAYTRDEWYRASQLAVSGIGMRGNFVHLYVNGLYWGLFNPVQRQDAGFMVEYFGGEYDDWMTLNHGGVKSGDDTRYEYLINTLIDKDMTVSGNYNEAKEYVDVEKFCDYLIVCWITGMTDWPNNNFYGGNRNNPPEGFQYFAWDGEWAWDTSGGSNEGGWVHPNFINTASPVAEIDAIWHSLRRNEDFMQLFADRVYENCFNDGPLTDAASVARWTTLNNYIQNAVIAESARWGDGLEDGVTRTKDEHWTPEVNRLTALMNGNADRFVQALIEQGYYSTLDAPVFNHQGGSVANGFEVIITNPNSAGDIYFTTDGTDPRNTDGSLSASAQLYTTPILVDGTLSLQARAKNNNEWSPLNAAEYASLSLFVNEFLASNDTGITDEAGEFEDWIEIYNAGEQPADIGGMYITDDLSDRTKWQIPTTDPNATTIPAGGHLLLWADNTPEAGILHVNVKLGSGGEAVGLSHLSNGVVEILDSITFGPQTTDISYGRFPDGNPLFREFETPTPGAPNELPFTGSLFINEFLASNDSGITDEAGDFEDWIEVYNASDEAVDIGGMYITDDLSNPTLWQIPATDPTSTTIPAKGYLVLWADKDTLAGPLHVNIKLGSGGEQIGLVELIGADIGFLDSLTFGPQQGDVSQGRFPDGSETIVDFYEPTPGSTNVISFVANLWINEVQPQNTSTIADEFGENDGWIEIYNNNNEAIDIGGLYLSNDLANLPLWQIPADQPGLTTIPSKGFVTLWADNQVSQGPLHLGFTLNSGGGVLALTDIIGPDASIIDSMTYQSVIADASYGRYPDASIHSKTFTDPSPGTNNTIPVLGNLFINEFLASNDTDVSDDFGQFEDWIEIFNAGSEAVDIGGLFLTDDVNDPTKHQMPTNRPDLTTIDSKGFLLIWGDNQPQQGTLHANVKLSSSGEQIALVQINGTEIHYLDSLTFGGQTTDVSVGRSVDGGTDFVSFNVTTPNATNNPSSSAPTIDNCPLDISGTVAVDACEIIANWVAPTATDDGTVVSFTSTHDPGTSFSVGTTTVVYTAIDDEGNEAECNFNVTVIDGINPEISCPSSISVLPDAGLSTAIVDYIAPLGTDNCPGVNTSQVSGLGSGASFPAGITTETFTARDASGNSVNCSFTVTVQESGLPTITDCPGAIVQGTDAGVCEAVVTWVEPIANDLGTIVSFTSTHASGDIFPIGLTTVTYTATDDEGNTAECSFDVTINDEEAPQISCPLNISETVEAGITNKVVDYITPVGTDNCTGVATTQTAGLGTGGNFPVGETTETYSVTDGAGLTANCSFTITVIEIGPPVITNCPTTITQGNDPGVCEAIVSWVEPTASDDGSISSFTKTHEPGSVFPVGTTTVTYTATDNDGNTTDCSFDVIINDTAAPQISCPAPIVVTAAPNANDALVNYTPPVGTDNCSGAATVQTTGLGTGANFPVGTTTETFVVTDGVANATTCSFTVTVEAAQSGPSIQSFVLVDAGTNLDVLTITEGLKIVLGDLPTDFLNIYAVTNPLPTGSVELSISGPITDTRTENVAPYALFGDGGGNFNGTTFVLGQYSITAQAFEGSSGSGEAGPAKTINFELVEFLSEAPVITGCPVGISQGNDIGVCGASVSWPLPVATDDGTVVSFTSTHNIGDVFPVGTTTVTYTATDNDGLVTTCSFDITVNDMESPQISCPAPIVATVLTGVSTTVIDYTTPVGTDNCPAANTAQTEGIGSGGNFPVGVSTESYTVTDAAGNSSSCSFTVTITETGPPIISGCPATITQSNDIGLCEAIVSWTPPVASDEGTVTSFTSTHEPGAAFPVGTTTVTYTAIDNEGEESTCSFDIVVNDTELPELSCPADIFASVAAGVPSTIVNYAVPKGSDNCPGESTALTGGLGSGASFPVGATTETYTITDAVGNAFSCSFVVTVIETGPPTISGCPSNITQANAIGQCEGTVTWVEPTAVDEGTVVSFTSSHNPGDVFPVGTTTVTYTATDNDGNTSTCSFDVIINDTELPQIACPENISTIIAAGETSTIVNYAAPIGTDNCTGATTDLTQGLGNGGDFPLGTTTESYMVTDAASNTANCSFTVTVIEAGPPVVADCPENITTIAAANSCEAVVTWTPPTASDEGTIVSLTSSHNPGDAFPVGTTIVTYTATDNDANQTTCSFSVTVGDTQLPQINCPANIVVTAELDATSAIVTYVPPVGTDNCSGVGTGQTAGLGSGSSFPLGTTVETYTATDGANNTASCSFNITVEPASAGPRVTAFTLVDAGTNQDITTLTDGLKLVLGDLPTTFLNIYATTNPLPTGSVELNISGPVNTSRTENVAPYALFGDSGGNFNGNTFELGVYTLSAQAFEGSSGSGEAGPVLTISFELVDELSGEPVITNCPTNINQSNDAGLCEAIVSWTPPVATDDQAIVSFVSSHAPGQAFPVGVTTVTYTATDNEGNIATCSFDVSINDATLPQIACPSNITTTVDESIGIIVVDYTAPVGTDNCLGASTSLTAGLGSGASFAIGNTVETYTVTDGAGNEASCSFTVTVNAVGPPVISNCPSPITQGADADVCEAQVSWTAPTASDEGSVVSFTSTHNPGSVIPVGTTTVTYTATDNDGNTSTCSFDVVVEDTEAPQIDCPANISIVAEVGTEGAVINYTAPVGTDNCSGATTNRVAGLGSGSEFPIGTTTETYEVSDAAGNSTSCSFTITVEAPVQGPSIQSFVLVDASTNQDVLTITEGAQIVLGDLPGTYLNIYAVTGPAPTGSVELSLAGALSANRTENVAPYALYGDNGGNFNGETFGLGQYTVSAQAFEGSSGSGESGPITSVNFEIVAASGSARIGNSLTDRSNQQAMQVQAVEPGQWELNKSIQLYPNPANERLHIQLGAMAEEVTGLMIFDPMGRRVVQKSKADLGGVSLEIPLDKWRFSEGMYILIVKTKQGLMVRRRFIISRK